MPDPVEAGMWLAGAVLLSWIAIGFLAAALTFVGVAVFPLGSAGLWAAAGVCFLVACVVGALDPSSGVGAMGPAGRVEPAIRYPQGAATRLRGRA